MKVISLPDTYLKEQFCNKVQNFLIQNLTNSVDNVVVLPRCLSVISKRILDEHALNEAALMSLFGCPKTTN